MPRASRVLRLAAAALAALVVAGCASIPVKGAVQQGNPVETRDALGFDFRPQGPEAGATPSEILTGFLAAGAGPQSNYEVARSFLSSSFAGQWNPNASVLIHGRATTTVSDGDAALQLVVPATGRVDDTGRYDEYASAVSTELPFSFVQEDGQWRISDAPDGIVLPRAFFDRLFEERPLYFYDPTYSYLVPDLRWFPATADAPTRIVEALLAGPSAPLAAPVLASAFPSGTTLERQSVATTGGEAVVELNDTVVRADDLAQQRMQYQLSRTLVGGAILSAGISVDGSDLDIPSFGSDAPTVQPLVNSRAVVGRDGAFGFLSGDDLAPLPGISDTVAALDPTAAVYSGESGAAAVLASGGVSYVAPGQDPVLIDSRDDLIAPTLDSSGYVWSVPGNAPLALTATPAGGTAIGIAAPGLADATTIVSIAVSRDSTRLLVLLGTAEGARLRVFGIVRDATGAPVGLSTTAFELVPPTEEPIAATWVTDGAVASLGRDPEGASTVSTQEIGGQRSDVLGGVVDAVALVGGNGLAGLRLLTADGSVQVLRGSGWQPTASGVAFLASQR